jgi:hypothetical protein
VLILDGLGSRPKQQYYTPLGGAIFRKSLSLMGTTNAPEIQTFEPQQFNLYGLESCHLRKDSLPQAESRLLVESHH